MSFHKEYIEKPVLAGEKNPLIFPCGQALKQMHLEIDLRREFLVKKKKKKKPKTSKNVLISVCKRNPIMLIITCNYKWTRNVTCNDFIISVLCCRERDIYVPFLSREKEVL